MKYYKITEAPIEIYGLEVISPEDEKYHRLPEEETVKVSKGVNSRAKNPAGARVRFKTDADVVFIKMGVHSSTIDKYIPLCGSAGADVYVGVGEAARFRGVCEPSDYTSLTWERKILLRLNDEEKAMRQVTVDLPRNHPLSFMEIGIEDGDTIAPPEKYSSGKTVCFYGSSITEGGCASRPGNAYTATLSRRLDFDYVNYGFSGSACGEDEMADIINRRKFDVLVIDYDHNAFDPETLWDTHERFFKRIRAVSPEMPIVIVTKPDFFRDPVNNALRRDAIRATYDNATTAGDKNVYFVDGESFFADEDINACTVDMTHPTDHGFACITKKLLPLMKELTK